MLPLLTRWDYFVQLEDGGSFEDFSRSTRRMISSVSGTERCEERGNCAGTIKLVQVFVGHTTQFGCDFI